MSTPANTVPAITDTLPLVVIESPYKGDVEKNVEFARNIGRWAIEHGRSPFIMHLLYTQMLNDLVPAERAMGISCGLSWTKLAPEVWCVLRPGEAVTSGMQLAIDRDRKRIDAGEPLVSRQLVFTQEGEYVSGWEGPLPERLPAFASSPSARAAAAALDARAGGVRVKLGA